MLFLRGPDDHRIQVERGEFRCPSCWRCSRWSPSSPTGRSSRCGCRASRRI